MSVETAVLEELVDWLAPMFSSGLGYTIVAVSVALERSILIGLVIPGEVMMALGAIFAARGELEIVAVIALGAVAAMIGESVGFLLGRRYGWSLLRRLPLTNRLESRADDVRDLFGRHGGMAVAIGRFATAAGAFIPFVAGLGGMRYRRFLAFDVPAVIVWAVGVGLVGFLLGRNLGLVDRVLARLGWGALALLALMVIAYVFLRRRRHGDPEDPSED